VLSLVILPYLVLPEPRAAVTLASDAEAQWVAFTLTQSNLIRFAATLDGAPVRAILDTGLSHSFVTASFAADAGIAATATTRATAIGGNVEIGSAPAGTLRFGGVIRKGGRIGISGGAEQGRFGADLYVGADVLGCCALDIDYDARRFRVIRSGRLPFTGPTARLGRTRAGLYVAEVSLSGKRLRPLVVDTGDGSSITLSRASWLSLGYSGSPVTTSIGWGIGGVQVSDMTVLGSFALAGHTPPETEVRIEGERGFSAQIGVAGRIGNGVLMRYRVLLDPGADRLVLRPGAAAAAPVQRSTSGLLLEFTGAELRVAHVMRGSPAAAGGWKAGEAICMSEGMPVATQVREGLVDWGAGAPGRTVRLGMCDGSERVLTLARFY
jgi:hypothetical protein